MSGLTRKIVYADSVLATILGAREGDFVSYAEISKGLHRYIKNQNLRIGPGKPAAGPQPAAPEPVASGLGPTRVCSDCAAEIPPEAIFCDLCGVRQ